MRVGWEGRHSSAWSEDRGMHQLITLRLVVDLDDPDHVTLTVDEAIELRRVLDEHLKAIETKAQQPVEEP